MVPAQSTELSCKNTEVKSWQYQHAENKKQAKGEIENPPKAQKEGYLEARQKRESKQEGTKAIQRREAI